ncbi:hypothetical protein Tsubulata_045939, partial [Turnera subulata]
LALLVFVWPFSTFLLLLLECHLFIFYILLCSLGADIFWQAFLNVASLPCGLQRPEKGERSCKRLALW